MGMIKNSKKTLVLFVMIWASGIASSADAAVEPKHYAHLYKLNTSLEGAIYRLHLPRFVYEGLLQSQRHDLAVFNANAEIVPFAVREATPTYLVSEQLYYVPFYELPPQSRTWNIAEFIDAHARTGAGGRATSAESGDNSAEISERRYLLDFSSIAASAGGIRHELRLRLPDTELSAQLSIFDSANLRDWDSLLTDAPLVKLRNAATLLAGDRVELPRAPQRYVLLRIRDIDQSFELKGVDYSVSSRSSSIREESAYVEGTPTEVDNIFAVEYDVLGAFPISKINFVLQEPGFHRVRYFSRTEAKSTWQMRGNMELSKIMNHDGSVRSNTPIPINMREDRYWRIEFEGAPPNVTPKMKFGWRPGELFFLTQGGGPYILAFGSPKRNVALQDASFLQDADAMKAEIGFSVAPIHSPALVAEDKISDEEATWQRYLVWIFLVTGSLLLSAMALKLVIEGQRSHT